MSRLINKNKYGEFEPIKHSEVCEKLSNLEDLEDELGCPLGVVFKALKYGIYCLDNEELEQRIAELESRLSLNET